MISRRFITLKGFCWNRVYQVNGNLPSSSSNALTPIKIDGWEEDAFLSRSKHLHRVEVFKRRNRRTKQPHHINRDCY
ncbi:hypothetical protein H5410_057693 [Solanum commersonii]|uniref:Uncharacterized protein n=1 Tax=Solanum commersonii TaxID=4109 RepID=A0A9J5WQR4_SOLCO|nr:hypothetical protein H5410_057693 [Solanum commersonii]